MYRSRDTPQATSTNLYSTHSSWHGHHGGSNQETPQGKVSNKWIKSQPCKHLWGFNKFPQSLFLLILKRPNKQILNISLPLSLHLSLYSNIGLSHSVVAYSSMRKCSTTVYVSIYGWDIIISYIGFASNDNICRGGGASSTSGAKL